MSEKLKVGILVTDYTLNRADYETLDKIINGDFAIVPVVIKCDVRDKKRSRTLYEMLDKKLFKVKKDYTEEVDGRLLIKDIPEISINPSAEINPDKITDASRIKEYHLDIILQFGSFKLPENLIPCAKYGIWYTRFYDPVKFKTEIPVYWEFFKKTGEVGTVVQMITKSEDLPTTIYRSWELMNHYSLNINRNRVYGRASLFVPRILRGMYLQGNSYLDKLTQKYNSVIEFESQSLHVYPSLGIQLVHLWKILLIILRHVYKKVFYTDYWYLLVKVDEINKGMSTTLPSFTRIDSPKDRFWADPFIITSEGRYFLFVEEFINKTKKGHISVLETNNKGEIISTKTIIDQPYHMAYPFIFEHDGTFYMIPDTSQNKTIEIYQCKAFPDKWELVKVLMNDVYAADTTLYFDQKNGGCLPPSMKQVIMPGMIQNCFCFTRTISRLPTGIHIR